MTRCVESVNFFTADYSGSPPPLIPISYPDLSSLPEIPDLVMVCVAASRVPSVLEECARINIRHIHILSSGFKEIGTAAGEKAERQLAEIAEEKGLLIIGPNCMGPYCPASRLTAWGAIPGQTGSIGIISQSGTIAQRMTEMMCSLGVGVEKAVSIGNATVLTHRDFLAYMVEDPNIRVIAMYIEGLKDGKSLLDMTRKATKIKPVVIWKGGESQVGASTISSHTGKMAGKRHIWEAFFRQSGAVRAKTLEEWADATVALNLLYPPEGKGVFLIGGGGGHAVVNGDTFIREGFDIPALSDATMERLRQIVPAVGSIAGNPLDQFRIFQDSGHLSEILELGYRDPEISLMVIDRLIPRSAYHLPDLPDSTPEVIDFLNKNRRRKPTVFTVETDGGDDALAAKGTAMRAQLCAAGIPAFPSTVRAARALSHLCYHHAKNPNPE